MSELWYYISFIELEYVLRIAFIFLSLCLFACSKPVMQQTVKPAEPVQLSEEPGAQEEVDLLTYCASNQCRQNVEFYLQTDNGLIDESAELYWPVIQADHSISLLAGEKLYITGELNDSSIINLSEASSEDENAISFELTQNEDDLGMLLVVKNPYDFAIKLKIDMVDFAGNLHPTSSCPIVAGGGTFEMWPHPIPELIISEIHQYDETESLQCVY